MKRLILLLTLGLLCSFTGSYAQRGSCAANAHCAAAAINAAAFAAATSSSGETDVFKELRRKICTGYIVYGTDTLDGIIVCSDNSICIRQNELQDSTYTFSINDTNLTYVMLEENQQVLFMTRLENKKLYRILHEGKLSVYDTYFSFDHGSKRFFDENSWMKYDGHSMALNTFFTTSVKRKLITNINKVYGSSLTPGHYKKTELLSYIARLD